MDPPPSGIRFVDRCVDDEAPMQRKPLEHNGISVQENLAVRDLSQGRVDLHGIGASVERVASSDARLRSIGAHSLAQGSRALVGREQDRGHEIWHLAQQAMGRVQPDSSIAGQPVARHPRLEPCGVHPSR